MQSYDFLRLRCFRNHAFFLRPSLTANAHLTKAILAYLSVFATTVSSTLTPGPIVDASAMLFMYLPLLVVGLRRTRVSKSVWAFSSKDSTGKLILPMPAC